MQAQESKVAPEAIPTAVSKPKGSRLVIRVTITPDPPPQPSIAPRAVGVTAAVIALLTLGWVGIDALRDESASPSMAAAQRDSTSQIATMPSSTANNESRSPSTSVDDAAADVSPIVVGAIPATPTAEPAVLEPVNEVIPDAPRSALQTITGTVRVAIRVDIDKAGKVVATRSEIPGPSRYFERLSREAATRWTFTPTTTDDSRTMLLRFYYKREGVSAEAIPPN